MVLLNKDQKRIKGGIYLTLALGFINWEGKEGETTL
jgi:hypothetical protein